MATADATPPDDAEAPNPWHVVNVQQLDAATIDLVIEQVHVSHRADMLAHRESEIDALWTLADMAVRRREPGSQRWLELLWDAHDHVGDGEQKQALEVLATLRDELKD